MAAVWGTWWIDTLYVLAFAAGALAIAAVLSTVAMIIGRYGARLTRRRAQSEQRPPPLTRVR